jgi:UDP-N-acetylmuramoyl-L-alanyl-D-glutamate--2,6-diaminopimelate ligase
MIGNEIIHTDRTTPESYDLQSLFAEMNEKSVQNVVMEVSSQDHQQERVSPLRLACDNSVVNRCF